MLDEVGAGAAFARGNYGATKATGWKGLQFRLPYPSLKGPDTVWLIELELLAGVFNQ